MALVRRCLPRGGRRRSGLDDLMFGGRVISFFTFALWRLLVRIFGGFGVRLGGVMRISGGVR